MRLSVYVPIRTLPPNAKASNPFKRNRKVQEERGATHLAWVDAKNRAGWRVSLPCVVRLTRITTGKPDADANENALKHVRDQVAVELGLKLQARKKSRAAPVADDSDPRVTWLYAVEKGESGVRIEVEACRSQGVVWDAPLITGYAIDAPLVLPGVKKWTFSWSKSDRSPEGGYRASCACVCCKYERGLRIEIEAVGEDA